jgi:hypothetical protein
MIAGSTLQSPGTGPSSKPGFKRTTLAVLIVVIIIAGSVVTALYVVSALSLTTMDFMPYSASVSQNSTNPSSLTVVDPNGGIFVSPTARAYLMITGTVTARGMGAKPNDVNFIESNSSGDIIFQPVIPPSSSFFSTSYTVDITVFIPSSAHLRLIQATTVNGNIEVFGDGLVDASIVALIVTNGHISSSGVKTSSLFMADTNGNIGFTCSSSCASVTAIATNGAVQASLTSYSTGAYTLKTVNGDIDLTLPLSPGFTMTATSTKAQD